MNLIDEMEPPAGPPLLLRPEGRLSIDDAGELASQFRGSHGEVELDLTQVDSIDLPIVQLILVMTAHMKRTGRRLLIIDSEAGGLRSILELAGIRPELAGLSAKLTL